MIFSMIKKQWLAFDDVPILRRICWISKNVWDWITRIKVNKKIGNYRIVTYGIGESPEIQIYHDDICIAVFGNSASSDPKSVTNFPNVTFLSGDDNVWKTEQGNITRFEYKVQCRPYKITESSKKFCGEIGKKFEKNS